MPEGISGMYELILKRLGPRKNQEEYELFGPKSNDDKDEEEMRRNVLQWIAMAQRPLTVEEMQYILATEEGVPFDPSSIILPQKDDILKCCDSFVQIYNDENRETLGFTHFTVSWLHI
jgi:hypothetical protein